MNQALKRNVELFGVPSGVGYRSDTGRRADHDFGPEAVRQALIDLRRGYDIPFPATVCGDLNVDSDSTVEILSRVEAAVLKRLQKNILPIMIGGAHTVTLGALRAAHKHSGGYSLIYFDAHPDIMPRDEITYGSHLYVGIKEGVLDPARTIIIGARQIEEPEYAVAKQYQISLISSHDMVGGGLFEVAKKIQSLPPPYVISFDIDVVDPSFAPAVACPTPLGLDPREVLYLLRQIDLKDVLSFDLVELSPRVHPGTATAELAAMMLIKFLNR